MKKALALVLALALLGLALPAAAQGAPTPLTATVIFDAVYLRQGPGIHFPVAGEARHGDTLAVVGRNEDGSWFLVQLADGGTAWLADYLVSLDGDPATLPVADAPAPASSALLVPPGCEYFNIGPFYGAVGQSVVLVQGWEAATRELVEEYLSSVIQLVTFDGRLISTYNAYAGEITFDEGRGTWQVFWRFDMGPVSAGQHRTEWTQMFSRPITDGLDASGDGQPDTYGPDPVTYGCTLIIE